MFKRISSGGQNTAGGNGQAFRQEGSSEGEGLDRDSDSKTCISDGNGIV